MTIDAVTSWINNLIVLNAHGQSDYFHWLHSGQYNTLAYNWAQTPMSLPPAPQLPPPFNRNT